MSKNQFALINRWLKSILKSRQERRHELVGAGKLWKMKRDFQITFLNSQGLQKTDVLLDIGCGTLRGGIPIIQFLNSGNYYGIDVRKDVLLEGQKELKASKLEHKSPTLLSFDHFSEISLEIKFDIIFAFSVLIHFEDKIAEDCFKFVAKSLKTNGVFYANVNIGEHPDGNWHGFPVVFRSLQFYENLARKYGMELEVLGNLRELGHDTGRNADYLQKMLKISKG